MNMKRVAIVGGGISGLSAAFALEKFRSAGVEYVLFEASDRFGGVICSDCVDGCLVEAGPDSFLTEKPWAAELCRELGIGDQLIGSNDAERKTYILVKGRLVAIPEGLMFMVPTKLISSFFSPLFSWNTRLRMISEWFSRPVQKKTGEDETVGDFVWRHYGRDMVERVADPLLAGVYGGSVDELSVQSVLPRLAEIEAKHGSLGRGMARARKWASNLAPLFTSLKNGMQQMVDALLREIPEQAKRASTRVEAVKPESGKWLVVSAGRAEEFDAVIMATPSYTAAEELQNANADLAAELSAIGYSSSVTVVLGFDENVRDALPPGFGFLVPRIEGRRILAATLVHNKFPRRAPPDRALIRCFLGGTRDSGILECSEEEIQTIVMSELREILSINAEPLFIRIYRWKRAMAQYGLGHSDRVARVRNIIAGLPGLALAGNAYSGIGVPDCVRSGSAGAAKILGDLGVTPAGSLR